MNLVVQLLSLTVQPGLDREFSGELREVTIKKRSKRTKLFDWLVLLEFLIDNLAFIINFLLLFWYENYKRGENYVLLVIQNVKIVKRVLSVTTNKLQTRGRIVKSTKVLNRSKPG